MFTNAVPVRFYNSDVKYRFLILINIPIIFRKRFCTYTADRGQVEREEGEVWKQKVRYIVYSAKPKPQGAASFLGFRSNYTK
jgi:hypothetical protein